MDKGEPLYDWSPYKKRRQRHTRVSRDSSSRHWSDAATAEERLGLPEAKRDQDGSSL